KPNAPNPWWKAYFDPKRIQMRDRLLFANLPLPANLAAVKDVDWSAVDMAVPPKKPIKKSGSSKSAARLKVKQRRKTKSPRKLAKKGGSSKSAARLKVKQRRKAKSPRRAAKKGGSSKSAERLKVERGRK